MLRIPERIKKMVNPKGFDSLFEEEVSNYDTRKDAFIKLNREYMKAFGKPRYENFKSFDRSYRRRLKSRMSSN